MLAISFVVILFLAFLLWHYLTYNAYINAGTAVQQTWSNTEVELKRRLDLIGNLIEVVKGYSKHEAETLLAVVKARNVTSAEEATASMPVIKDALTKIFALSEAYPEIKASNQFLKLQEELAHTENRIAERRHAYNSTVSRYQNLRHSFPSNLVGWVHHFDDKAFFDAPDDLLNEVIQVRFS